MLGSSNSRISILRYFTSFVDPRTLTTKITIPNGAILILGGLIREDDSRGSTGIPVLSKIPVLKYLIGTNVRKKQRRELVVLLQARIIESADDILDVNVSEIQRTVVGPDAELFVKPDRNTDNVKLPTFENDVPFNQDGTRPEVAPAAPVRRSGRSPK